MGRGSVPVSEVLAKGTFCLSCKTFDPDCDCDLDALRAVKVIKDTDDRG